jgi:SAM-dependent methyltransferase
MPANRSSVDVTALVQKIRAEVGIRMEHLAGQSGASSSALGTRMDQLLTLDNEIDNLNSQINAGEPRPESESVRTKLGQVLKSRLYRFLWWQSWQIKTLASFVAHRSKEETRIAESLSQEMASVRSVAFQGRQQVQSIENRLRTLESAQLKLQVGDVERKVRERTVQEPEATAQQNGLTALRQETVAQQNQLTALRQEATAQQDQLTALREETTAQQNQLTALRQETSAQQNQLTALREQMNELRAAVSSTQDRLTLQLSQEVGRCVSQVAERLDSESSYKRDIGTRFSELGLFAHQTRTALTLQERRLSVFFDEVRKRSPEPVNSDRLQKLSNEHKYDALYVAFEDLFRGTREEIKSRQSSYLPLLREIDAGNSRMSVVDLGCGRGEWLELLRDNDMKAHGVDGNYVMIQHCRSAGLDAVQGDALDHLRGLPDASQGAVTSFHMVEHLPFEVTLAVIDEALRVLKPGGVLILETPNPQNILVGACNFYFDPTHLKPLPSPMLRFFVEARGFCDAQIWDLHPYPKSVALADEGMGIANRLNQMLYGPQDYAIVARRPGL